MNCTECDDKERSQNAIKKLKHTHTRMTTVLNELEILEDGKDADYSELVIDYRWIVSMLEQRREQLQSRGRCL